MATRASNAALLNAASLGSIRTEILIAFVFSLLTLICVAIAVMVYGGIALFTATVVSSPMVVSYGNGTLPSPVQQAQAGSTFVVASVFGIISLVMAAMLVLSVLSFVHINRMRHAADSGNIAELKRLNSVGWAVIALIFNGLISGILLLVAHGPIIDLK